MVRRKGRSEVKDEAKHNDSQQNKGTSVVRTVVSLFKDLVISAAGVPHFQSGAVDYKTYLERAIQMGGEITDSGLPQTEDGNTI